MPKRKAGFDVDRLGSWYTPSKSRKRDAVDRVTEIMAPRSAVTGSEARDQLMAKTLSKAPKVGNRLFSRKRPYKPRSMKGGSTFMTMQRDKYNQGLEQARHPNTPMNAFGRNLKSGLTNGVADWDEKTYGKDRDPSAEFWDDFKDGFKYGFNGITNLGKQLNIPGAQYIPTIGGKLGRVMRKMPCESKVNNTVGTGVHHSVPDIKLNPELRDAVAMVTGNTPLDPDAANSVANLKEHHTNHIKNYVHRRKLPGLRPRNKITKGGRTFTTLKNILVTPDAAP